MTFNESDHPRAAGKFTDKPQTPAETTLVAAPDTDTVLAALPANGDPIPFGDLVRKLGIQIADQKSVADVLRVMAETGAAGVIYGRGWRRLPLPTDI